MITLRRRITKWTTLKDSPNISIQSHCPAALQETEGNRAKRKHYGNVQIDVIIKKIAIRGQVEMSINHMYIIQTCPDVDTYDIVLGQIKFGKRSWLATDRERS